jgi:spoIIIJ-associated protein
MEFSEKWGRSVEEAVELALKDLRLDREQVEIVVLEEPAKGFFGLGSKLAKVRVEKKSDRPDRKEARPAPAQQERPAAVTAAPNFSPEPSLGTTEKPAEEERRRTENNDVSERRRDDRSRRRSKDRNGFRESVRVRQKPENLVDLEESPALDFLREMTAKMDLDVEVKAMVNEECLYFDISGKDSGTIIGKRGQTLDSIQYLTSLVANKEKENYRRVIVDAENYREKRERTLEQLANRLADKVLRTGKSVRLEPMNPYERKVIHATLQRNAGVTTRSEGEEPYRRVIIEQK